MTHRPITRRNALELLTKASAGILLVPHITASSVLADDTSALPFTVPQGWDPIAFNKERGNAGAIPQSYLGDINGPDGVKKHLGKHLPYVPPLNTDKLAPNYLPIMWGDPAKGHTMHPNAPKNESNGYEGHWYNWIKVRKAVPGSAQETTSRFSNWPESGSADNGHYAVHGDFQITDEKGIHTVYMVALPEDVQSGDTVRIWAHCLTHGEYVDFLTLA